MRLMASHNYRAYPELDRFSDEQCGHFVRTANRSWRARGIRWTVLGVMALGAVIASVVLTSSVMKFLEIRRVPGGSAGVLLLSAGAAIESLVAGMLGVLITRDWLLGRRVRRVLRLSGTCYSCGYSLLGMRVGEDLVLHCPECGAAVEVDPAMNELAEVDGGAREYRPQVPREQRVVRERRLRRRRLAIRWTAIVVVGSAAVLGSGYGVWWWSLVRQARVAGAARNGHARVLELSRSLQPAGFQSDAETEAFAAVLKEVGDVVKEVSEEWAREPDHVGCRADFSILWYAGTPEQYDLSVRRPGAYISTMGVTKRALEELRARGTFERLRVLPTMRALALKFELPEREPLVNFLLPTLGQSRQVARLSAGRMHLALGAGDREEYLEVMKEGFALVREVDGQGTLISRLVGSAILSLLFGRIEEHASAYPDVDWVRGVNEIVGSFQRPPYSKTLEFERIATIDTVRWFYSDASRVRMATITGQLGDSLGSTRSIGVVGFERCATVERELEAYYRAWEAYADAPLSSRGTPPAVGVSSAVGGALVPALTRAFGSDVQSEAQQRRVVLSLAMEEFRLTMGRYPTHVDEIRGLVAPGLLVDLASGQELVLTLVSDALAPGGQRPVLSTPPPAEVPSEE